MCDAWMPSPAVSSHVKKYLSKARSARHLWLNCHGRGVMDCQMSELSNNQKLPVIILLLLCMYVCMYVPVQRRDKTKTSAFPSPSSLPLYINSPCSPLLSHTSLSSSLIPITTKEQRQQQAIEIEMAPCLSTISSSSTAAVMLLTIVSKSNIYPDEKSSLGNLKLSVSDLPMLSCHYIQKGLFFPPPHIPIHLLLPLLRTSLSRALSFFPALAGRLSTDSDGLIYISCNDAGTEFTHALAPSLTLPILLPDSADVPQAVKSLFIMDGAVSFQGHFRPLAAFQFTELGDGAVFIGCTVNHAIVDGTSFWNFFNAWAELCRSGSPMAVSSLSRSPDFRRNFFGESKAVIRFPDGKGPEVTFNANAPLRERIFHFSRDAILQLKSRASFRAKNVILDDDDAAMAEIYGKQVHDPRNEISSFQSLCAQLWISVTRARKQLRPEANTTFRMAVNCRHRVSPRVDPLYFGNAIQSIPTTATVSEVRANDLSWAAGLLHGGVVRHGEERVRKGVAEWEAAPRCFPLGNPDGAGVTMGSSPRFPMYDGNDFGWGPPLAVRSGKANKFDGKISAFPGRSGGGSVELEVCLAPETMAALVEDEDFMCHVSSHEERPLTL